MVEIRYVPKQLKCCCQNCSAIIENSIPKQDCSYAMNSNPQEEQQLGTRRRRSNEGEDAYLLSIGNTRISNNRSSERLSSSSTEHIVVDTLEQLAFYESAKEQNLLDNNRYVIQIDNKVDDSSAAVLRAVKIILRKHPSTSVVLEVHSGLLFHEPTSQESSRDFAVDFGLKVGTAVMEDPDPNNPEAFTVWLYDRISVRAWGKRMTEKVSASQDPLRETVARHPCLGWVEIFLRIQGAGFELELPPRPDFYVGIPFPKEQTLDDLEQTLDDLTLARFSNP